MAIEWITLREANARRRRTRARKKAREDQRLTNELMGIEQPEDKPKRSSAEGTGRINYDQR
ncbi:hypothetical protein [Nocardia niigatensis]|uniref:hypothetical protein n=1 Tax=Nocardia niigatensis TaxID=209249 RepID=UPI0012F6B105|nr:hypothetical protein [Nocardia niigatensis]